MDGVGFSLLWVLFIVGFYGPYVGAAVALVGLGWWVVTIVATWQQTENDRARRPLQVMSFGLVLLAVSLVTLLVVVSTVLDDIG